MREIINLRGSINPQGEHLFTHQDALYYVLNEYELNDNHYAIMKKQNDPCDDLYLFRIQQKEALDIEDESEWDRIVEAIDELYS